MKKIVVIYESKYGSTKRYAQWIAQALSCPLFERKNFHAKDFAHYDTIIYGGGLYAGGVSGIRLLTKNWPLLCTKQVILFTCGLADPSDPANVSHIRNAMSRVLSSEMLERIQLFHFRGGIDYQSLSFIHKSMMSMLRRKLLKQDPQTLTQESVLLLETYGKHLDFTSRESIQPLVSYVLSPPASFS